MPLKLWTMQSNYFGEVWPATYVGLGRTRDSDPLERANFDAFLDGIGGQSDTVQIVRERHWACGWVEWIAIHQDDETAVAKGNELLSRLDEYPILDEDLFSRYEYEDEFQDGLTI